MKVVSRNLILKEYIKKKKKKDVYEMEFQLFNQIFLPTNLPFGMWIRLDACLCASNPIVHQ